MNCVESAIEVFSFCGAFCFILRHILHFLSLSVGKYNIFFKIVKHKWLNIENYILFYF